MSGCESHQDSGSSSLTRRCLFCQVVGFFSFVFGSGKVSVTELLSEWLRSRDPGWWTPSKLETNFQPEKNTKIPTVKLGEKSLLNVSGEIKKWKMLIFESTESRLPMVFFQKKNWLFLGSKQELTALKKSGSTWMTFKTSKNKTPSSAGFFEWSDWRSRYVDFMNISWKKCLDALQGFLSIHLFLASF